VKRILTVALVLLVAVGLGLMAVHSHAPGQDCNICKLIGPASTALFAVVVTASLTLCAERALPARRAAPLRIRHYLSPLRAPPSA
jgi:hypothetical protein